MGISILLLLQISLVYSQNFVWRHRSYSSVASRLNYGMVFKYVGSGHVPHDYWPHTFHSDLSKKKRSLLPFIGKFSKSLFGTGHLETVALSRSIQITSLFNGCSLYVPVHKVT